MRATTIEWTDFSTNPLKFRDQAGRVVWACVHESPGCKNCYAESIAKHYRRGGPFNVSTMNALTPFLDEKDLRKILTAQKVDGKPVSGSKCFPFDMTDLFGDWVPDELIDRVFAVMSIRRDVTFQILTKRAKRMREYLNDPDRPAAIDRALLWVAETFNISSCCIVQPNALGGLENWPLRNVWAGVSVESPFYLSRIEELKNTQAAVRFVSFEPLLADIGAVQLERIHWIIIGAESGRGPSVRGCSVDWMRSLLKEAQAQGVAAFMKQFGTRPFGSDVLCQFDSYEQWVNKARSWLGGISGGGVKYKQPERAVCVDQRGRVCHIGGDFMRAKEQGAFPVTAFAELNLQDPKGGDPSEWPPDLNVREYPYPQVAA